MAGRHCGRKLSFKTFSLSQTILENSTFSILPSSRQNILKLSEPLSQFPPWTNQIISRNLKDALQALPNLHTTSWICLLDCSFLNSIFLVLLQLRFYCVMIVLKRFMMPSPALLLRFWDIWCFQMYVNGFSPVAAGSK